MTVSMGARYSRLFGFKTGAIGLDTLATVTEELLICVALSQSYYHTCVSEQKAMSVCSKMNIKENA